MNKKALTVMLYGLLALVFLQGCSFGKEEKSVPASLATNVTIYKTGESYIENTATYSGELTASDSVSVSAKLSAKITGLSVKEGDYVDSGAVLLTLDKNDASLSYQQAKASYNSAVANYNSVVNSASKQSKAQARQALASAETAYNQAKLNLEREQVLYDNASNLKIAEQNFNTARDNYERMKSLFELGGASKTELDTAYTQYLSASENLSTVKTTLSASLDAAKSAFDNAQNALNNAKENISLTDTAVEASIKTASASVDSARVALDMAQNNLNNTVITAPISGYISKCIVSEGQTVAPGVEIITISNTKTLDAKINVSEGDIAYLKAGDDAEVVVSSVGEDAIIGKISVINPVKDAMTGLYAVRVSLDNSDDILKAGMLCDVKLLLSSHSGIIKIPSEALINSGDEYFVYIASQGNKAKKIKVDIGIADGEYTEIISGLYYDDEIIVSGKDYLSEKNNEINITGEYTENK